MRVRAPHAGPPLLFATHTPPWRWLLQMRLAGFVPTIEYMDWGSPRIQASAMPTRTDKREDSFARARELVAETPAASLVAMLDNDAERDGTGPASEALQVLVQSWLHAMAAEPKAFSSRALLGEVKLKEAIEITAPTLGMPNELVTALCFALLRSVPALHAPQRALLRSLADELVCATYVLERDAPMYVKGAHLRCATYRSQVRAVGVFDLIDSCARACVPRVQCSFRTADAPRAGGTASSDNPLNAGAEAAVRGAE